jgi:hypothetical protein
LDYDEIKKYIDARYVAPREAVWEMLGFSTAGSSHTVYVLSIHLPDHHLIYFRAGLEEQTVYAARNTTLLAWF